MQILGDSPDSQKGLVQPLEKSTRRVFDGVGPARLLLGGQPVRRLCEVGVWP